MKYENMKEVSRSCLKKYKILQKLVYLTITENIASNLSCVAQSVYQMNLMSQSMALY